MDFHGFRHYVFITLRNETNVIIYYYLIPCRLSTEPKMYDLGLRFAILHSIIFFLFTVEYVYATA